MHFHWRHPKEKICVTLAYDKDSRKFLGINTFGIRMRHEVLDRWLSEKLTVREVVSRLGEANFDPEFYARHEPMIQKAFKTEMNSTT